EAGIRDFHVTGVQTCALPILLPSSIEECFEFGYKAHDLADTLQTPVLVLSDLDLGMNNWMGQPFEYPTEPLQRGKVLSAQQVAEIGRAAGRERVDIEEVSVDW